jgi:hypothetical protein
MLQLMLHAHPRIAIPPETRFLLQAYQHREDFGDLSERRNRRRLARFIVRRRRSKLHDLGLDPNEIKRRIVRGEPTIGSAVATVFQAYAERFDKPRWGDKRPAYILRLDVLLRLFPDAQIVHLIRDGRDCVASLTRMPWWRGGYIRAAAYWNDAMRAGRRARRTLPADQYHEVRYEDLVAHPRTELTRLCEFLGEEFDERMLEPHRVADVGVPERKTWHVNTRREINAEAVERFTRDLEPHELALLELVCRRWLRRQGYAPTVRFPLPRPTHLARFLRTRMRRAVGDFRRQREDRQVQRRYRRPVAMVRLTAPRSATVRADVRTEDRG